MADENPTAAASKPDTAAGEAARQAMKTAADAAHQAMTAAATQTANAAAAGHEAARKASETVSGFSHAAAESQTAMLGDMTRMFKDMRFPSMVPDSTALMAAHRRNMEVLSAANRLALEGAQAVARRHMEIMQQTMTELSEHVRELGTTETPQAKASRQAELMKRSYERAVTNIRELSDLIQQSNGEALGLLNNRFKEAMDEVKTLLDKSGEAAH